METKKNSTVSRIQVNDLLFSIAIDTIARYSHRVRRFGSLRESVVEGLQIVLQASVISRSVFLKRFDRQRYFGETFLYIKFNPYEWRLVHDTKTAIQEVSLTPISTHDTIVIGLIAASKQVTDKNM